MNLPKISSGSNFSRNMFFLSTAIPLVWLGYRYIDREQEKIKTEINQYKSEILIHDPKRYEIVDVQSKNLHLLSQRNLWEKQYLKMQESLETDSLINAAAQKAYFEGMQAVRDSINNTK